LNIIGIGIGIAIGIGIEIHKDNKKASYSENRGFLFKNFQ